jgi:antitoxin VapB
MPMFLFEFCRGRVLFHLFPVWYISTETAMTQKTKIFNNGRSQAVRLPAEFRFDTKEVYIRRDPATGDVVLSKKTDSWDEFFRLRDEADVPDDFVNAEERSQSQLPPDPFEGWKE